MSVCVGVYLHIFALRQYNTIRRCCCEGETGRPSGACPGGWPRLYRETQSYSDSFRDVIIVPLPGKSNQTVEVGVSLLKLMPATKNNIHLPPSLRSICSRDFKNKSKIRDNTEIALTREDVVTFRCIGFDIIGARKSCFVFLLFWQESNGMNVWWNPCVRRCRLSAAQRSLRHHS